jgi:hypothetical protein
MQQAMGLATQGVMRVYGARTEEKGRRGGGQMQYKDDMSFAVSVWGSGQEAQAIS